MNTAEFERLQTARRNGVISEIDSQRAIDLYKASNEEATHRRHLTCELAAMVTLIVLAALLGLYITS